MCREHAGSGRLGSSVRGEWLRRGAHEAMSDSTFSASCRSSKLPVASCAHRAASTTAVHNDTALHAHNGTSTPLCARTQTRCMSKNRGARLTVGLQWCRGARLQLKSSARRSGTVIGDRAACSCGCGAEVQINDNVASLEAGSAARSKLLAHTLPAAVSSSLGPPGCSATNLLRS